MAVLPCRISVMFFVPFMLSRIMPSLPHLDIYVLSQVKKDRPGIIFSVCWYMSQEKGSCRFHNYYYVIIIIIIIFA